MKIPRNRDNERIYQRNERSKRTDKRKIEKRKYFLTIEVQDIIYSRMFTITYANLTMSDLDQHEV